MIISNHFFIVTSGIISNIKQIDPGCPYRWMGICPGQMDRSENMIM
jgi:hypothetical protein